VSRPVARILTNVLRFALELSALSAVGAWGWQAGSNAGTRVVLAAAGALAVAIPWGQFVAPRAPRYLPRPGRLAVEIGVFTAATLALGRLGHPSLAAAFAVLAVADTTLVHLWREDDRTRLGVLGAPTAGPR
jgi:hypothetical protein